MRILYIDTSSSYLYAAISENDSKIVEIKKEFGRSLSEEALPEIVELFQSIHINPADIDKIMVVSGPGSFTGIRIGMTIAKVCAWSMNIPITTITSLEAMNISSDSNTNRVPVINARRGNVFAAIYDSNNRQIMPSQLIKIVDLQQKLKSLEDYIFITNDDIEIIGNKESYSPKLQRIINYYKDKESINPHAVNPEYLKLTEAEENLI